MEWSIALSRRAEKFLSQHHLSDQFVIAPIKKVVLKLEGEAVSVDVKQLSGKWAGYYRIRSGKMRIIFSFDADGHRVFVEVVDYRGSVYR